MRIKIHGRHWRLRFPRRMTARGECDGPHIPNKEIRVRSTIHGEERLEVLIHEMMHAADWFRSEEAIHEAAHDITKVLWRLGYRQEGSHDG